MSLYNIMNGVNQATFLLLPMLGKHPDEYPRFRDCFPGEAKNSEDEVDQFNIPKKTTSLKEPRITVYTRTGGGNRESYEEENKKLTEMPEYVMDFDDDFDSTFAYWVFKVPEKFLKDYDLLTNPENTEGLSSLSEDYKQTILKVYPKLEEKLKEVLYPTT